jgi:hypothetical protein
MLLAATDDKGRRFGHHCCRPTSHNSINIEVSRNKLISTLIYGIYWIASTRQRRHWNEHAQGRPPLRRHGFIKSTLLEGLVASPPWWWCLVGDLCFLCGFWLVTCQSATSYLRFRGVTKWATQACTIPGSLQREWIGGQLGQLRRF